MQPRFVKIKSTLLAEIKQGTRKAGDRIPSENQLAEQFGVSRMTARRALTELTDEGVLMRAKGLGTFVADARPMSLITEVRSIKQEIEKRGHKYTNKLLSLEAIEANAQQSAWLGLAIGSEIFHSEIIHFDNGKPLQFEERYINPNLVPNYLKQNFTKITVNQYLSQAAPLTQAEQAVEAVLPTHEIVSALNIDHKQPCLTITRRTYSDRGIVSYALLHYPGNRYRIGGQLDFQTAQSELKLEAI